MSIEAMKKVLDAEQLGRAVQTKAAESARAMVEEAEAEGMALLAQIQEQAGVESNALMQEAEKQGALLREEILQHAENQCAVLRAHAQQNLAKAADLIVERIVTD